MTKLYCFVDETGQDTKGRFFLVAIVLKETEGLENLKKQLLAIESSNSGQFLKWKRFSFEAKMKLLQKLANLKELQGAVFYSTYQNSSAYTLLTALAIAKAVLAKATADFIVNVTLDGLNDKEREVVSHELKKLKVRYRKIRGMKDEQNVFLRLAHIFAGFLRDYEEKQSYAITAIELFKQVVSEV